MRVITWNMGLVTGGKTRLRLHDQAWHYLLGLGPDLAFVQEALPPSWVPARGSLVHGPFTQWGSAIFSSRYPLQRFTPPPGSNLHALGSYLALATASLPDGSEAFIASVHARHGKASTAQMGGLNPEVAKRRSVAAPMVNDVTFLGLAEQVTDPFILAGDWNTARTQSSKTAGLQFFERVTERGWHDCVWDRPQDGEKEEVRTWFGGGTTLIQDDHAFCDKGLGAKLRSVWVAEDGATHLGLSDHAPLVLDFDVPSIAMTSLEDDEASGDGGDAR